MHLQKYSPFPWGHLLSWYKIHGRHHLPWRQYNIYRLPDPRKENESLSLILYRVWLSEILLQQTQVDRVIPYFERILKSFPTIDDLAHASYDVFFPYYQGMGYYSRARNILKTAKIISEEYNGIFPREKKLLQKLPGVGPYTSSALLAFGYGEPFLAWDTNLEKVFSRYYNGTKYIKLSEREKSEIEKDFYNFCLGDKDRNNDTGKIPEQSMSNEETEEITLSNRVRSINNALMDFASIIDLKNPDNIDWSTYPIPYGVWYNTRGNMEPKEEKIHNSFPIPDATIIVILHQNHQVYYSQKENIENGLAQTILPYLGSRVSNLMLQKGYQPFIIGPSLQRDTRRYVQSYFREYFGFEVSVRPVHKKWFSEDGKPFIAVNVQVQTGNVGQFIGICK